MKCTCIQLVPSLQAGVGEALVKAALQGDVDLVASLLEQQQQGTSSKDERGFTPLGLVAGCDCGSTELVRLLIERGADVNMPAVAMTAVVTPLGMALDQGHEEVAALLIEHGADVNALGLERKEGELTTCHTPLMQAARKGLQNATKLLLERGADVNMKSENSGNTFTPLGIALMEGHEEVAALLIEHGADVNAVGLERQLREVTVSATPLMAAAMKGLQHSTKLLLERGADVNMKSENSGNTFKWLDIASTLEQSNQKAAAQLIKQLADINLGADTATEEGSGVITPLGMALDQGHEEVAALLIEHGADVNAVGIEQKMGELTVSATPLMQAAWKGLQLATKLLLERNAEVDKETEVSLQGKSISVTALMYAATAEEAKLLLDHGAQADFQASHGGLTALMVATIQGRYEVAELLLERGAQVDLQDSEGMTALMRAVVKDEAYPDRDAVGLARLLLQHGANPQLEDREENTALAHAVEQWDTELIELLTDPAKASAPRDTSQHTPRPRTQHKKEPITIFGLLKGLFSNLGRRSREVVIK